MKIVGIDPGTNESAWVLIDEGIVEERGIEPNHNILEILKEHGRKPIADLVACEMVACYGMPVGREVFETCLWIGRFLEASGGMALVYRRDIKLHLCGSARAKDPNVRQALLDKLGQQGTKKEPGPTYGIRSHEWAALAVAIYAGDHAAELGPLNGSKTLNTV